MKELLKLKVLEKTNGLCFYCQKVLKKNNFHIDHLFPKSKGGKNDISNYVPSCDHCNCKKNNKDLTSYMKWLKEKSKPIKITITKKMLSEAASCLARQGGNATFKKRGVEHYKAMANKRWGNSPKKSK